MTEIIEYAHTGDSEAGIKELRTEYRNAVKRMVDQIEDTAVLRRIYTLVIYLYGSK